MENSDYSIYNDSYKDLANNTDFIAPVNPGAKPTIPNAATGPVITEANRQFDDDVRSWREYQGTDKALKKTLLEEVEDIYILPLRNNITGYGTVTTRELLDHMHQSYCNITPVALADNDDKMKRPYDQEQPIERVFDRIKSATEFADAGKTAYSKEQIIEIAYNIVFQSGVFMDDCREWQNKDSTTKSWATFKTHFAKAYHEMQEEPTSAWASGFHDAAMVAMEEIQAEAESTL